ncbi:MAG TPA: DUF1499 domain-containing protein [Gammaproteobacteria bacterium]|nr:DUF1499 domain-containing protein [Gammaproteobacteria bacterium]
MISILVTALVMGIIGLGFGGLALNRPPLGDPPGVWARLATYFGSHVAETHEQSPFPELRPRRYSLGPEPLYDAILAAIRKLGWQLSSEDRRTFTIKAVVTTPLWRFKDDVEIGIKPAPQGNGVYIRSSSRIGKGDLAANTRHVLDLYQTLDRRLRTQKGSG